MVLVEIPNLVVVKVVTDNHSHHFHIQNAEYLPGVDPPQNPSPTGNHYGGGGGGCAYSPNVSNYGGLGGGGGSNNADAPSASSGSGVDGLGGGGAGGQGGGGDGGNGIVLIRYQL